ncbi:H/ACA ribonucleoprotein complex subunit GAR1 [Thermofilum pendens]|uniref:Gar1-like small nucleolar rnp n=1 Tax=Thermofilum pendens (strain DSM 2475 / Hrk 5) TaxID=368408 RepID=A1RX54_THEPD|nr:Gar1/Naf1 family protein [Thermofilum pendens]ABL77784.1 gar1 - like small nucleolar rnp [Thermofilum pendens Hrk 5]
MQLIGRARLYSRNKNLVVEASNVPPIGEKVYDEKAMLVGYVYDVIGPVTSPFVLVKVDESRWEPEALVGKLLYWSGNVGPTGGKLRTKKQRKK